MQEAEIMRKLRTITIQEIDEEGEIQALKLEASKRIAQLSQPASFKAGDLVKVATNRRHGLSWNQTGVVISDPDKSGEYGFLYLDNNGDFQIKGLRRDEMKLHEKQQKLLTTGMPPK
jgi:hypothetical protein